MSILIIYVVCFVAIFIAYFLSDPPLDNNIGGLVFIVHFVFICIISIVLTLIFSAIKLVPQIKKIDNTIFLGVIFILTFIITFLIIRPKKPFDIDKEHTKREKQLIELFSINTLIQPESKLLKKT